MVRRVLVAGAAAAAWLLVVVQVAVAARGSGEQVGDNLGGLLGHWARSLYLGIAALVALVFLVNRRFADLAIFFVAATVVGGFVLAPNDIAHTVRGIWQTLAG